MIVICIPAYEPNQNLIDLIESLENLDLTRIVITDDGSGSQFTPVFAKAEEMGSTVVRHERNFGKGAALRTAIEKAQAVYGPGIDIVTADSDLQHTPRDIRRVADALESNPGCLILGVRDFDSAEVPARSSFGNRFSSAFFKAVTGIRCADTQTGLRGIPSSLLPLALREKGDRYEYEMNFLMDAVKETGLVMIPIETVYRDDAPSHFRVLRDSVSIYRRPLLRLGAGLAASTIVITVLYTLFEHDSI